MEKKKKKKLKIWSLIRDRWRLWLFEAPLIGVTIALFLDALCCSLLPSGLAVAILDPASEYADAFARFADPHSYFVFWGCAVVSVLFFLMILVGGAFFDGYLIKTFGPKTPAQEVTGDD